MSPFLYHCIIRTQRFVTSEIEMILKKEVSENCRNRELQGNSSRRWNSGRGYRYLKPMSHGGHCRTLPEVTCEDLAAAGAQKHKTKHPAGAPFRHCGFVIPCDADEYCDETQARRRWHQSSHARLQCLCGLDQRLLHGHAGRYLLPGEEWRPGREVA